MNQLTDQSSDRKYFTIMPRLVWALSRSPYDLSLWHTIKAIAGESGECYLSTTDLATMSMMSTGKVSECRGYLIKVGLLSGEVRRDPGYPQPVWHLRVPDLWERSIAWATENASIKVRLAHKLEQKSLHAVKPSPHEQGTTPHEQGTTPHETKKNHKKNQAEEPLPVADAPGELPNIVYDIDIKSARKLGMGRNQPYDAACGAPGCSYDIRFQALGDMVECLDGHQNRLVKKRASRGPRYLKPNPKTDDKRFTKAFGTAALESQVGCGSSVWFRGFRGKDAQKQFDMMNKLATNSVPNAQANWVLWLKKRQSEGKRGHSMVIAALNGWNWASGGPPRTSRMNPVIDPALADLEAEQLNDDGLI